MAPAAMPLTATVLMVGREPIVTLVNDEFAQLLFFA
jgi:hypothetical protein